MYYKTLSIEKKKNYKEHYYYFVTFYSPKTNLIRDNYLILDGETGNILYEMKKSNDRTHPFDNLLEQIDKEKCEK